MRKVFFFILIILTNTACSQKTTSVIGYFESFYSDSDTDSSFVGKVYSEEHYQDGKQVYNQQFDIWVDSCYEINRTINDSLKYRIEFCQGDSSYSEFHTKPSQNLRFNIKNSDTTSITNLTYLNDKIVRMKCIKGCDSDVEVSYSGDTTFYKYIGSFKLYSWEIFDKQERQVCYALPTEDISDFQYFKHTYDDQKRTKTTISGYKEEINEYIKVYYDKNWVPLKKEVVVYNDGFVYLKYDVLYKYI